MAPVVDYFQIKIKRFGEAFWKGFKKEVTSCDEHQRWCSEENDIIKHNVDGALFPDIRLQGKSGAY